MDELHKVTDANLLVMQVKPVGIRRFRRALAALSEAERQRTYEARVMEQVRAMEDREARVSQAQVQVDTGAGGDVRDDMTWDVMSCTEF